VSSRSNAFLSNLRVELVDKGVGADVSLATGVTDQLGRFTLTARITTAWFASRHKQAPDLQVHVLQNGSVVAASIVRYDATKVEELDVQLPTSATVPSEFETLVAAISAVHPGPIAGLVETDAERDVTYVANKSGWDARAVAMAVLAYRFTESAANTPTGSATTTAPGPAGGTGGTAGAGSGGTGSTAGPSRADVPPAFYYALLRAGLSSDQTRLQQTDPRRVEAIWKQGIAQNVISSALTQEISAALEAFIGISSAGALQAPPVVGVSKLGDVLDVVLGSAQAAEQQQFAELLVRYGTNHSALWTRTEHTLGAAVTAQLKTLGQLAYLTANNAPLLSALYSAAPGGQIASTSDLVTAGLYQAAAWQPLMTGVTPPAGVPGSTPEEKTANYAELLAAKVRISFPTATVGHMASTGAFGQALGASGAGDFLAANPSFDIGNEPIGQYLARTGTSTSADVVKGVSSVQRMYQITPDHTAMATLLSDGLDSGYAVTRISRTEFASRYADKLGGADKALAVHRRAELVHSSTVHVALSYVSARRQPGVGGCPYGGIVGNMPSPSDNQPAAQATLETLFGDLDYCACDDCQSITSPAAYLVDLLDWSHNDSPAAGLEDPRAVLLARRPDIGALPLTCDNTNLALPYLDLVNEVLEYYVGNITQLESLQGFTGYSDDGTVSSAELIAAPQNDGNVVADSAYDILKTTWFPAPLPFYRDLELLRLHIGRLGISLSALMEAMRTSEALEAPAPSASAANPYGWRDILLERLGLSRLENRLLTDSTLTLDQLYGNPSISTLSSLREFSRVTAVAYSDVVSILQTRFVNPGSGLVRLLDALAVPYAEITQLHNGTLTVAAFEALLPTGLDTADYAGGVVAWVNANYATIGGLIVIDVAGDPCDTSEMTLQYLNGNPLTEIDFLRFERFIRLWRKLGLTVEQTDDLISALYPPAPGGATPLAQLDNGFLTLLPRAGIVYEAADVLGLDPGSDLASLLACLAPISTAGTDSLYGQMFLNPTVLRLDPAFAPDVNGNFFTGPAQHVLDHKPAIIAALNLTGSEFDLITGPPPLGLGYTTSTALSLDTVSDIYRRGWLARALSLSVLELLSLIAYTGVDPFQMPTLDDSHPVASPLLEFVRRTRALSTAGLAPVQALYLLWNADLSGVSAPPTSVTDGLATALRAAFVAIDSQFSVSGNVTPASAQALMSLVLGAPAADTFFGLLQNTFRTSVSFGYSQPTLPAAVTAAANGLLSYDDFAKTLSFSGYLTSAMQAALDTAAGADAGLIAGIAALAASNTLAVDAFFATYDNAHTPWLRPLFDAYTTTTADPTADRAAALATLLDGLLPVLGKLRKQEQAYACAAAAAACDPSFAPALLGAAAGIPATADPSSAGVTDLTALDQGGLSAKYFLGNNPSAPPDQTAAAVSLTYGTSNPLPAPTLPATAIAAKWNGFLSATQDGDFNLRFVVDAGATVTLSVGGSSVPLTSVASGSGTAWSNTAALPLRAGALTPVEITATGLSSNFVASWETVGTVWQQVPAQNLYAGDLLTALNTTTLRFLKATALAGDLLLSAPEIAYLATAAGLTVGGAGWLAALNVDAPAPAASYADLTAVLDGLTTFATLKATYSPLSTHTPQLLTTLVDMSNGTTRAANELIALTGWDAGSLQPLLGRLFGISTSGTPDQSVAAFAALSGLLANLVRLQEAFAVVKTCGLSALTLIEAATNDPSPTAASTVLPDFQSAVRSRYAESDWLTVVQPINDHLREMQRDALVAYVLARSGGAILNALGIVASPTRLPTADDLFNYFLIDVEMEPCMLTSRVRLALSSVQLFIERCLRNLEPTVDHDGIDPNEWEWRKRYRVWQANREVFLWPENWLDPSFRDDKSPIFQSGMSQLLQSDITNDAAASAYLDYLSNLELVAKLDPCALYVDTDKQESHVIARSPGAHRKYYYRRFTEGSWTPWEEVKLAIDDTPLALYVWNGRLMLFWLQIHHQPANSSKSIGGNLPKSPAGTHNLADTSLGQLSGAIASSAPGLAAEQVGAVLYFSEYYNGSWQPTKSSDVNNPLVLGTYQGDFDRSAWYLRPWSPIDQNDESLWVQVGDFQPWFIGVDDLGPTPFGDLLWQLWGWTGGNGLDGFVLHNTHSAPLQWTDVPATFVQMSIDQRAFEVSSYPTALPVQYWQAQYASAWSFPIPAIVDSARVLTGTLPVQVLTAEPNSTSSTSPVNMPFFFGDARSVFYVTCGEWDIPIYLWDGFGVTTSVLLPEEGSRDVAQIPPLVLAAGPIQPDPPPEVSGNVVDSAVANAAVSAGAARAVIGGGGIVAFDGRNVGITGSAGVPPSTPPPAGLPGGAA
jgi:hypothetical protein